MTFPRTAALFNRLAAVATQYRDSAPPYTGSTDWRVPAVLVHAVACLGVNTGLLCGTYNTCLSQSYAPTIPHPARVPAGSLKWRTTYPAGMGAIPHPGAVVSALLLSGAAPPALRHPAGQPSQFILVRICSGRIAASWHASCDAVYGVEFKHCQLWHLKSVAVGPVVQLTAAQQLPEVMQCSNKAKSCDGKDHQHCNIKI